MRKRGSKHQQLKSTPKVQGHCSRQNSNENSGGNGLALISQLISLRRRVDPVPRAYEALGSRQAGRLLLGCYPFLTRSEVTGRPTDGSKKRRSDTNLLRVHSHQLIDGSSSNRAGQKADRCHGLSAPSFNDFFLVMLYGCRSQDLGVASRPRRSALSVFLLWRSPRRALIVVVRVRFWHGCNES